MGGLAPYRHPWTAGWQLFPQFFIYCITHGAEDLFVHLWNIGNRKTPLDFLKMTPWKNSELFRFSAFVLLAGGWAKSLILKTVLMAYKQGDCDCVRCISLIYIKWCIYFFFKMDFVQINKNFLLNIFLIESTVWIDQSIGILFKYHIMIRFLTFLDWMNIIHFNVSFLFNFFFLFKSFNIN